MKIYPRFQFKLYSKFINNFNFYKNFEKISHSDEFFYFLANIIIDSLEILRSKTPYNKGFMEK